MGWYTDAKRRVGRAARRSGGKIARTTAIAAAGVAGTAICFGNVACGFVAAAAADEFLGGPIERSASRALDRAGSEADDFVEGLRRGERSKPPLGMATTIEGSALPTRITGDADEAGPWDASLPLAVAAGAVTTIAMAIYVLKKTGRI